MRQLTTLTSIPPAQIPYVSALSATQLTPTATLAPTTTFSRAAGAALNAGSNQALTVHFVPTDAANYSTPTDTTVHINVLTAMPTITWSNPADITYGTALSATQLNATASVAGTFTYSPAAGAALSAGSNQALTVHFVPTDAANYGTTTDTTVHINVSQATPTVAWSNPTDITYGTALGATQLNATASVPGTFTYTPTAGEGLSAGSNQALTVHFVPNDAGNYDTPTDTTVHI